MTESDRETVRRLVAYLPILDRPGLRVCEWRIERNGDSVTSWPPEYDPKIYGLFSLIVPPFADQEYLSKAVKEWLQHPSFLENASPEQLRTVLTWMCRGERFCDGHWKEQFENGNLIKALRRLKWLQNSDFDVAASARVEEEATAHSTPDPEIITMRVVSTEGSPLETRKFEDG